MTKCKRMAREALKAVGEATREGTHKFHQAVFVHLCSTFHPGCSSWQTPGDFSMGPIPRERRVQRSWVGSIPPCTAIPSCLPRAGTRRGLQRAPCSARVPQTYVFKGSRCRERCLPILSALTAALGALPLFITLEKQERGVSLHGDAAYGSPFCLLPLHCTTVSPFPTPWHHHGHSDLGTEGRSGSFPSRFPPSCSPSPILARL